jgi:putative hydrolase of the HAD superfamily
MMAVRAVLWDFGGVILESPFDAFRRYEREHGLPDGFLRGLNATDPQTNAWARLERSEIGMVEFCDRFEAEAAREGHTIVARDVLAMLSGRIRPEMVQAVRRCAEQFKSALLTNNFVGFESPRPEIVEILDLFDVIVESSKAGIRKPDPAFYTLACDQLGVSPSEAVFLDDLGVNLKPARAMGMQTIKVDDPAVALSELEAIVGITLA